MNAPYEQSVNCTLVNSPVSMPGWTISSQSWEYSCSCVMQSLSPTLGGRVWATTTILLLLPLPPYELHFHFLPIHLSAKGFLCLMYQRPRDCSSPPFFTRCPLLASMSTPHHDPRSYPGKIKRLARNVSPSFGTYLIGCLFIFNLMPWLHLQATQADGLCLGLPVM